MTAPSRSRLVTTPGALAASLVACLLLTSPANAQSAEHSHPQAPAHAHRSITDTSVDWPSADQLLRVLTMRDYNTRVVVIGTTLLGMAAGVIGTFAYLRKRALMGDALSHATLPGIAAVFLLTGQKSLVLLILGATATGILGVLCVVGMGRVGRLKEDAAIGIVLSVFFGAGMVLLSLIQQTDAGNQAGLQTFIYGKAAAMLKQDAWLIGGTALAVVLGAVLLLKEFRAVCFDQQFAAAQGWPVTMIDLLMMALVVLTTVVGLQAVGIILVVALLIIPPAAARFWTDGLVAMLVLAGVFGVLSGWLGSTVSALMPRMPTGALIVIAAGLAFLISMLVSPHRGVLAGVVRQWTLSRKVAHQNLLRALAECEEQTHRGAEIGFDQVLVRRSWSPTMLRRLIARAARRGVVASQALPRIRLTDGGRAQCRRVLRNHRLWETYLIKYADIAPSHVDRDADEVEHVLSEETIAELTRALAQQAPIPPSPHPQEVPG